MELSKLTPRKNTAQAMVEFAIVLPILLLLLYGLLEAGRLLFMYSTIVTASRQAARYGSATGEGINVGIPRYQDCAGIRVAANRVDFLNAFDEYDVIIQHDTGPGDLNPIYYCTNSPGNPPDPNGPTLDPNDEDFSPVGNTERIVVTIEGDFNPIVPRIVPFIARTEAGGNPITAISARTIITGVSIEVTPPPGSEGGSGTGGISLSISPSPNSFTGPNESITYTFTITNSSAGDITGPFIITGAPFSVDCSAATTPLASGASTDCAVVTYVTTAADVSAGSFEFTATVSGTGSDGNPVTDDATSTITYSAPVENPAISLTKTASTDLVTGGDQITYTFTLTNTGNVDLSGASVSDPKLGGTIAGCSGGLAVGASLTCTATYIVTSADVQSGSVDNTATASATYNTTTVTATASATADIYEGSLFLTASASPTSVSKVGDVITYTYRFKNNTSSDLYLQSSSPLPLSGHRTPSNPANCPSGSITAGGGTVTCTLTYTVTQADLDGGITNTVTGTACTETNSCNGNRSRTSNTVTVKVNVTATPSLTLQVAASPLSPIPPSTSLQGQAVTYTYTLTNTGNVTLKPPFAVVDAIIGNTTCSTADIPPNGTKTCTKAYTVTQADSDAGSIPSHQVTASATFGSQLVSANGLAPAVTTYSGARLRLEIIANPITYPEAPATQVILYTYRLTNTGTIPLNPSPDYMTISQQSDGRNLTVSCPKTPLAEPGDSVDCTATDTISGPAGSKLVNTATAVASDGQNTITSNTATATVSNPVLACNSIVGGPLAISGPTMSMTITNPNSYAVIISSIEVTWNHDLGRQQGSNARPLNLLNAKWNPTPTFWTATGTVNAATYTISTFSPSSAQTIAASSTTTIVFTFDNDYANIDKTEKIKINLSTAGCETYSIQSPPIP